MQKKLTFGSLFSGIGGFDLGLERAGMECLWQCEIDTSASKVLSQYWPDVQNIGDVKNVTAANLPSVDVIVGGFPCQDVSVAGKREGLAGSRSGLWWEFHRVIREFRPSWVVIENVPGLLSSNEGRDFAAELGYGVAWRILDAQYFGVPQRRRRVFIVGHLGGGGSAEVLFEPESSSGYPAPGRKERQEVAIALRANPEAGGSGDGVGVFPHQKLAGTLDIKSASPQRGSQVNETDFIVTAVTPVGSVSSKWSKGTGGPAGDEAYNLMAVEQAVVFQQNQREEVRDLNGVAGSLTAEPGMHNQNFMLWEMHHASEVIRINNSGVSATLQARMGTGGNQVPLVSPTLTAANDPSRSPQSTEVTMQIEAVNRAGYGVRRLTPSECESLQGFPKGWTANGQADSPRYKQLGNAVAVPVIEWIGRRIVRVAGGFNASPL